MNLTSEPGVIDYLLYMVVCPNFGHPALTPSFTKYNFLQVKTSYATIVNELSVLKLFQLSNSDLLLFVACLQHLQNAST